ncbi:hypothetical protein J7E85_01940 [Paenibacillus sp. ISL-20]|nr:hypothetical protein [Paenibacillus sp. ISL-20]
MEKFIKKNTKEAGEYAEIHHLKTQLQEKLLPCLESALQKDRVLKNHLMMWSIYLSVQNLYLSSPEHLLCICCIIGRIGRRFPIHVSMIALTYFRM